MPSSSLAKGATLDEIIARVKARHAGIKPQRFTLTASDRITFEGTEVSTLLQGKRMEMRFKSGYPLFLIHQAWNRGADFEDLADGYGEGAGTHGDWSGIRDSSDGAQTRMLERALNHLFPETS
jgi:hypothetical protein